MSNVKVNGNTYNDVTCVELMKADESGYAEYVEGPAGDSVLDALIANSALGDIERDDAIPGLEWLTGCTVGTVSFPYATALHGVPCRITAENLLFPNVLSIGDVACGNGAWRNKGFANSKITGTLDLSNFKSVSNAACTFTAATIGTLKLGSYAPSANVWNASFTNIVWYGLTAASLTSQFLAYFKGATVTNLYVPAELKEQVQGYITDGTLTRITNVYSIDEWED